MKNKGIRNICIALLVVILFVYTVICVNSIMNKNKIGLFSIRFYIMSSDSPEAGISSGDLVFGKNIKIEDIKENDKIIYNRNNKMVVKKVKQIENNNGQINFYIEDDETISNEKLENAQIIGKVVSKIKGIGNVALFIQSPLGTMNVLIIIICIFIIIKKITKENQKDSNDGEKDYEESGKK